LSANATHSARILEDSEVASAAPILDDAEVASRKLLLAELQAALAAVGVQCILAGRQRLVLRYSEEPPYSPSGPVDPALHVFGRRADLITTNGACFRLRSGREFHLAAAPLGSRAQAGSEHAAVLRHHTRCRRDARRPGPGETQMGMICPATWCPARVDNGVDIATAKFALIVNDWHRAATQRSSRTSAGLTRCQTITASTRRKAWAWSLSPRTPRWRT
jgi:hypothetical protein